VTSGEPASTEPLDDAAFDAEFKRQLVGIIGPLRAFARGLCAQRTLADDLVQEAMLRAWSARRSYTPGTNFRAWIFMILRNQYYTSLRKNARMVAWDPEAAERILVTPATQHVGLEVADVVQALQKINQEQREVLILIGANGLSYEEAAQIMGCAVGTIKSRLARGRMALQALIEGPDDEQNVGKPPARKPATRS
tara:strand:+ start:2770 stop:3354 length:585 start_codon:yes stop_codon:yes gene_type:complete